MSDPFVHMSHDGIEGTARAKQSSFDKLWKGKGWVVVDAPEPEPSEGQSYDPALYTVQEVNDHLATLAEDDPERQRIIDLEAASKGRASITG